MAVDLAELGISVRSDGVVVASDRLEDLEKSSKRAEGATEKLVRQTDKMNEVAKRYGRAIGLAAKASIVALSGIAAYSLKLAVAAEETASKFQVVFRGSVEASNAQLVEMSKTIPLTVTQMRGLSSGVQDMLVPMGLARDAAAGLSVQAVQLAGDIASFNDVGADTVLENIQSALAGSSEPLRKYGIDVREARLQSIAYEKGLAEVGKELDSAARAQAVFIAITEDSSDAMGDAARTMDSTANQIRFMRRDFVQAQEDLGQLLIPAFNKLLTTMNRVDAEGMTPLQRGMQIVAQIILNTTKYALLLAAGFIQLKASAKDSALGIQEAFLSVVDSIPELPDKLTIAGFDIDLASVKIEDLKEKIADLRANRANLDAETEASLDAIFSTVTGIDAALVTLGKGVDRSLEDVRAGTKETGAAAADLAQTLTTDEVTALEALKDALDPVAKATRDLQAAKALLDKAFKSKTINITQYERLSAALERSKMAFDAFSFDKIKEFSKTIAADLESSFAYVESLEEMRAGIESLGDQLDPVGGQLRDLAEAREFVQDAFDQGIIDQGEFDNLIAGIDKAVDSFDTLGQRIYDTASLLSYAFGTMAQDLEEGTGAQRAFAIAAEAANAVLAIQAILNQGAGDPYTAFARIAAMAAVVASLGIRVASIASGSANDTTAADRQAQQGTGSILGDATEKSESILKATEITADATSELVGINRGMLHALQAMQAGIEGAVGKLARGGGDVEFGALPNVFKPSELMSKMKIFDPILGKILDKIFGGSAKVIDQGVNIIGGTIDEIFFQAFQTVKSKKHLFASTKIKDSFQDLDEALTDQFSLILGSIADTVTEAALALGLPLDLIEQRMASFIIETQKISLKDLNAEEQRDELLAVFSEIFDDLAGHVVPFVDQFQKVGEGLGETLVRVASSVQVFQEAVNALGLAVDMSDPEVVAQMAVGLVELTGGVSNFIALFSTFFDKFASDEQKLAFATDQLTRAFAGVGLTIPDTRDGMVDLMQSLDASTDSGRRQIAMLLELAGTADQYYSLLDDAEDARLAQAQAAADLAAEQAQVLIDQMQLLSDFTGSSQSARLTQLRDRFNEAMKAADSLGASQREYAMIARSFDMQLKRMAAELMISVLQMSQKLFGTAQDPSPRPVDQVREVANSLFTDWQKALEGLLKFTQSLLLDDQLTTLTPAEKLAEAQSQYDAILTAAMAGDVEAAKALPDAAKALLEEARFMFASGDQYQQIFDQVLEQMKAIEMPAGITETIKETIPGGSTQPSGEVKTKEDQMIEELQKFLMAVDLAEALRELSQVLNVSVIQLADQLGIPLDQLVTLMGVKLDQLTAETAGALAGAAQMLGANIFELIDALNVNLWGLAVAYGVELGNMTQEMVRQLADLANTLGASVFELADRLGVSMDQMASIFGISVASFEASQYQALIAFSDALGEGIRDVADVLGISLGDISDATSLLSQSLDLAIAKLPEAIQADLGPLLTAIREATTRADANAAIQNLGNYVVDLPGGIGSELIPFLKAIGYALDQSPDLSALQNIAGKIDTTNSWMDALVKSVDGVYIAVNGVDATLLAIGGFATGGAVNRTGLYQLHQGEFVVNPTASNLAVATPGGDQLSSAELTGIRNVLEDIRNQNREQHRETLNVNKGIESGVREQAEQTRRRANG